MLYLTDQQPKKGVMPFEVWARNDRMTVINLLFFIFATNSNFNFIS